MYNLDNSRVLVCGASEFPRCSAMGSCVISIFRPIVAMGIEKYPSENFLNILGEV